MFHHSGLTLTKLQREDLSLLLALKSESWETTHHITIATMEDQVRWFESLDKDVHSPHNLVLMACNDDLKIGIFKISNVDWVNRSADVAWDVFKSHRGNGFGKSLVAAGSDFCFRILNLWRLNCEILETNIASQKCAFSSGFKKEGVKKESVIKLGSYVDSGIYGLLVENFIALHPL